MDNCLKMTTIFLSIICINFFTVQPIEAAQPNVSAQSAILIDAESGRVLFEKNADEKRPIASITKIMTAIVAIEHGQLDDIVPIIDEAVGVEGSSIYLRKGEKMKLHHLLYGLMLRSGNDASVAIAHHIGGSVNGFVVLMNEKAEYLGMTNTHFMNPSGLDEEGHYSTARDMAKLTAYALKNTVFQEIAATEAVQVPNPYDKWDRKWYNKNKMLKLYPGADGVKTGYTSKAKRTLVTSATRNGQQLITVTLNAPDDWNDSAAMLNYGFSTYPSRPIISEGEIVQTLSDEQQSLHIVAEDSLHYPLSDEELKHIRHEVSIDNADLSQLKEGQTVGETTFWIDEEKIGSVPLIITKAHAQSLSSTLKTWVSLITPVWYEVKP